MGGATLWEVKEEEKVDGEDSSLALTKATSCFCCSIFLSKLAYCSVVCTKKDFKIINCFHVPSDNFNPLSSFSTISSAGL